MVTPSGVRDELAVGPDALGLTDADFNGLLNTLIDRETERVEDAIDVALTTETATESLSRPEHVDGPFLPLPDRPVQSVASVEIDTDRVGGASVAAEDYLVGDAALELEPGAARRSWPTDRRSVTVEWTHGYPESETPDVVAGAIIGLVRQAVQEIEADGVSQESIGSQSVNYELADDVVGRHLGRAKRFDEPDFYGGVGVI